MSKLQKLKPMSTRCWSVFPYSDELRNLLTTESRYGELIEMYKLRHDKIYVPRGLFPVSDNDKRISGLNIQFDNKIIPREGEQVSIMAKTNMLLDHGDNFIIQSPTGSGKTVIALNAIAHVGKKTLIVVTKEDLLKQWQDRAKEHLGLSKKDMGIVRQNKCQVKGKKLIIGMIQSLCLDKYPSYFFDDIGLVVWDECHRANATTFQKTVSMFPAKLRIGLSATPDRQDGKEIIFKSHIGPIRVVGKALPMVPKVIAVGSRWQLPLNWDGRPVYHKAGKSMHITKYLANDDKRNLLICKYIYAGYKAGKNIVAFSDLAVEKHLGRIKHGLMKLGVPQKDIAYYIGGMTEKARDKAIGQKIVLATYGSTAEATDVPWWDFAVLMTPRANAVQPVGRVLREYEGKKTPIVVDIVDTSNVIYKRFYFKRKAFYKKIGAEIVEKF